MGKKGNWFSSVKKALSPDPKKGTKSKKKWFGKEKDPVPDSLSPVAASVSPPHPVPHLEEVALAEVEEEQTKHAYSVAASTSAAAVSATEAAAEVVPLAKVTQFTGKSKEEVATIRIQTAFRGYLARRALRALRGLVRLKSLADGPTVKRQTAHTLKCMQTLSRVQSQISTRRIRMLEENRALQRQLMQKHAKELESLRRGDEWDDSAQSKEQIEASLLSKYEAAVRRERALAYSYSHQKTWKKSPRSANLLFMDPTNPQWGWSWLDRWMGTRPWETQSISEKELKHDQIAGGEITKAFARHQLNSEFPSPSSQKPSHQSPTTPSKPANSVASRKFKPARVAAISQDDDARSMISIQSERNNRRHSIGVSSIRDDESLGSSSSVPSYMVPTKSAKAKTRLHNPFGVENGTPEKGPAGSVKKRLSYPPSPARLRRHSGPPKLENTSMNASINTSIAEDNVKEVIN